MSKHEEFKSEALDAVYALIGDTSINPAQTLESLEEVQDVVESAITALRSELGAENSNG